MRLVARVIELKYFAIFNVPSYHLMAVDGDSVLEMRVGCGTFATKTPLLTSEIMRMDINPQWIIPHSIIKNSLLNQVGNRGYWARHHYYVREKGTGKVVPFEHITRDMLASGKYYVIQQGGIGNSLGETALPPERSLVKPQGLLRSMSFLFA